MLLPVQILSNSVICRAISEPYTFTYLHGLFIQGKIAMPVYKDLLRSVVRLQLKRERKVSIYHYYNGCKRWSRQNKGFEFFCNLFTSAIASYQSKILDDIRDFAHNNIEFGRSFTHNISIASGARNLTCRTLTDLDKILLNV